MSRKDKLTKIIREEWPAKLDSELKAQFGLITKTTWEVIPDMPGQWVTARVDGYPLTHGEASFIHGYMTAMNHVYIWNGRV